MHLVWVDPAECVIEVNVRTAKNVDPGFFESIKKHGVQQPPKGWRNGDGDVVIEIGQLRVLTARRVGLDRIPVLLTSREAILDEVEAEKARIIRQLDENDHRHGLTDVEHVAAYQQLALFGMKPDQIAKETMSNRDRVRSAVKLAQSAPATVEAMRSQPVTLDQAIIISEFDADEPRRRQLLEVAAEDPEELEFHAQRLRREVAEEAALQAEIDKIEAEGFRYVADVEEGWEQQVFIEEVWLSDLDRRVPTVEEAQAQGGLVCYIEITDKWDGEQRTYVKHYEREWWIDRPLEHGYVDPLLLEAEEDSEARREREAVEAEKEAAERERAEAETAWRDASSVRERWIINELLCSKRIPDGALVWAVAYTVQAQGHEHQDWQNGELFEGAGRWLGVQFDKDSGYAVRYEERQKFLEYAMRADGGDAWKVLLAVALILQERKSARWIDVAYDLRLPVAAAWLLQLEKWGHTLAPPERAIVDAAAELEEQRKSEAEAAAAADAEAAEAA